METWLSDPALIVVSGAILGHFLVGLFNTYLKNKDIKYSIYAQKLKVYGEIIDAYYNIADEPREKMEYVAAQREKMKYVAAQKKVELIADDVVTSISRKFYTSDSKDNIKIMDELVYAMRKDLEKTKTFKF